nr:pre-rRNA-processing protein TSR2 homolog [Ipomoea batatas]
MLRHSSRGRQKRSSKKASTWCCLDARLVSLQMAVANEWGGRGSHQKSQELSERIFSFFTQSKIAPISRQLPAFKGWSTRLLNQREKNEISPGGFGYGYIDEPQQPLKAIKDKKSAESEVGLQQYRANIAERPSFSLSMTSDEVDSVIRRVQKTATQSNAQSQEQNAIDAEFNTPTGPSTEKTPNLTQQTPTEDQTQPGEQQENVDEVMTL